uniref:Ergosterol biosynthesis 28 homolog n=1 Tax=Sinocyclocheilus rhinocerous TaxID=307959 RepID=A0A673HFR9_9TELE
MSRFLNVLRSWLLMVSVIAVANTVQHSILMSACTVHEYKKRLDSNTCFKIYFTLTSLSCPHFRLYHITLWTFVLALGHFLSEAFIYKTAPLTIGVMAPLIVASFSIVGMLIGFQCVVEPQEVVGARQKKRN